MRACLWDFDGELLGLSLFFLEECGRQRDGDERGDELQCRQAAPWVLFCEVQE
jgi:hypothetical protein